MTNLLLASASPRRRELLALLGLPFGVTVANVDEIPQADEPPTALVIRLSRDKARAVTADPAIIVIACDTVVALDGEILGKPRDAAEAASMLLRLRGRSHTVCSAVTLLEPTTGRALTGVAETQVTMRAYTDAEIAAYVASGDPLDKAGAASILSPRCRVAILTWWGSRSVISPAACAPGRSSRSVTFPPPARLTPATAARFMPSS
jgi:MAF protein